MPRRAKTPTEIRSLARSHCESAINVLKGIMNEPSAPYAARVSAAQILMDRGLGKAAQPITGEHGEGPAKIEIIERIVDVGHDHVRPADSEDIHTTH